MDKKAVLVTFTFTTRVVVPNHFDDERIVSCAATNIKRRIENDLGSEFNENFVSQVLDSECPYDPKRDKDDNVGVFRGH